MNRSQFKSKENKFSHNSLSNKIIEEKIIYICQWQMKSSRVKNVVIVFGSIVIHIAIGQSIDRTFRVMRNTDSCQIYGS